MNRESAVDRFLAPVAEKQGIPLVVLKAVMLTENGKVDPLARRVEPEFYQSYILGKPDFLEEPWYHWPEVIAASYGLMQVMYTTAQWATRHIGVRERIGLSWHGDPQELFSVPLNIEIGGAILAYKIKKYGLIDGIAAYNGGSPRKVSGALVSILQAYVDKVERMIQHLMGDESVKLADLQVTP